jgi:thiamine-phosphate pyrophosphorylase
VNDRSTQLPSSLRLMLIAEDARGVDAALAQFARGFAAVQLRAPALAAGQLLSRAMELREICTRHGAALLVNDRVDVALAAGADGVHLPSRGMSPVDVRSLFANAGRGAIVGSSCHNLTEVDAAERGGADYGLYSPIWDVPSKGPAIGLDALALAARGRALPLFALGGVTPANARSAITSGARGVACIRSLLQASDPVAAAAAFASALAP